VGRCRRKGRDRDRHSSREAVTRYGAVALTAFREVENSLSNERMLALQLPLDQKSLDDRSEAGAIARSSTRRGRGPVMGAQLQTAQLASEANLIKLRGAQRANRVRLYQVLGGSFRRGAGDDRLARDTWPIDGQRFGASLS
jgi:outer membrane protein TolC